MIIERLVVGPLETNAYLVACPATLEAVVIDPGGDGHRIVARIRDLALRPTWIVDTHGHADHIAANGEVKAAFPEARIAIHEADAELLARPDLNLSEAFGVPLHSPPPDVLLHHGEEFLLGPPAEGSPARPGTGEGRRDDRPAAPGNTPVAIRFRVIAVPGHTPGGIALLARPSAGAGDPPVLFCGDALFAGSMGRSDLPGGSHAQLMQSVRERLLTLPPETVVYPGHGESTTVGREARTNPFFA